MVESAAPIELDGQYRVLRDGAGVVVRAGQRPLEVEGADAAEYLQGQLTNDVEALQPGEGCYAALLDRKGRMQGDMRALRTEAGFLLQTEPLAGDAVLRHLAMYRVGREVELADRGAELALLSVIGPAAAPIVLAGPAGAEHRHRELELDGAECRAVTTDLGVDLICAADAAGALSDALVARGAEPVDERAAEILRVESGRPRFGREMGTATIPEEAGINERAVSFSKGCYIGQETVARLHYKGKPNRRLRGLRLVAPAGDGDPIRVGERDVGEIGTAVISPAHGPIALAIVRREAEDGAEVAVGDGNGGEVVGLPF